MPSHPMPALIARHIVGRIRDAMADTPVVLVCGPRQCGKTTLVRHLLGDDFPYVTLDDDIQLNAAITDPAGYIRDRARLCIDEVQLAPGLLRAIKKSVDEDRRPGRFLLTGSADILTLPRVAESLAGRMAIITLLPFSQSEVAATTPTLVTRLFAGEPPKAPPEKIHGDVLMERVLTGGYPEMRLRTEIRRRQAWAQDYLNAIIQRDVRDIASIEKLDQLPRLLRLLSHRSAQLTNFSQLGAQIGLDDKTTRKYVALLENVFLARRLEAWTSNAGKRLVKTPKLHFLDSGLLATLAGITQDRLRKDRTAYGPLLETFAYGELLKQVQWLAEGHTLHHYRDKEQDEVDIVIEDRSGAVAGVEVKASATVGAADFKGLRKLAAASQQKFSAGVVLYDGDEVVPFGEKLWAVPVSGLWG